MHDYARLDTISCFSSAFARHNADGTEDRWAWLHGFIATQPFFAIVCHLVSKKYFFLPLLTFIHLYWDGLAPKGTQAWRTAERKRLCATLAQDPLGGGGRNAVPADADVCGLQPHAAYRGIT